MTQRTCKFPGCDKPHNCKGYCRGHYSQHKRGGELRPLGFKLPASTPPGQRLAARSVTTPSGCREYTGAKNTDGYGTIRHDGQTWLAHRLAYTITHGPIGDGEVVRHTCDNPPCINAAHLTAGAQSDNVHDSIARDRFARGENVPTHKLTDADCDEIRRRYSGGEAVPDIAARFPQVHRGQVYRVAVGARRANPTNRGASAA